MKDALARADGVIRHSDARCAFRPVQLVLLDSSTKRVEEPLPEIAVYLEHVVVVRALESLAEVVDPFVFRSTLVFKAKAADDGQVRSDAVIRLRVEIVAIGDKVDGVGIDTTEVHESLAGGGESICTINRYKITEVVAVDKIACRVPLRRLFPLARHTVAHQRVPEVAKVVVDGSGQKYVLIGLLAVVGDAVEGIGAGQAGGDIGITRGNANGCGASRSETKVRDGCYVVILVHRDGVAGLKVGKSAIVIDFADGSTQLNLVPISAKRAGITFI